MRTRLRRGVHPAGRETLLGLSRTVDLSFTPEEAAFAGAKLARSGWRANLAAMGEPARSASARRRDRLGPPLAGPARRRPKGRHRVADRVRRPIGDPGRGGAVQHGVRPSRRAAAGQPRRHQPGRPDAARLRHRATEATVAAVDPRRDRDLVPALQRAGRRERPRLAHHEAIAASRQMASGLVAIGPEGVDAATRSSPVGACAWRAPTPDAPKHRGISLPGGRHDRARGRRAAAAADHRRSGVQRGVPRRRVRARGSTSSASCTQGWAVAGTTLAHERGTNFPFKEQVVHETYLDELWALAHERDVLDDEEVADGLAQAFVELRILRLHNWRTLSRLGRGRARSRVELGEAGVDRHDPAPVRHRARRARRGGAALGHVAAAVPVVAGRVDRRRHVRGPADDRRRTPPRPAQRLSDFLLRNWRPGTNLMTKIRGTEFLSRIWSQESQCHDKNHDHHYRRDCGSVGGSGASMSRWAVRDASAAMVSVGL